MPELPDITVYIERLRPRIEGRVLEKAEVASPFLLRTVEPSVRALEGQPIREVFRLGKRIVWRFEDQLFLVLHLMIAGRLHWKSIGAKLPGKIGLAAFRFPTGTLILTESGSKKRASLHILSGAKALEQHDPGGLEVLTADLEAFTTSLTRENHTLKRALSDPHLFSGIGNAYSDEILYAARLSPLALTNRLCAEEIARLFDAIRNTLVEWTEKLRREAGDGFPEKVTAFRPGMAVHGRFGQPCPKCGTAVQRIVYAENETNYCPSCQTAGRILADRSLSRLLKDDWPRTLEELDESRQHPQIRNPRHAIRNKFKGPKSQ
jgi:formamidopyrimidine-DNA glycosylase